MIRFLLLAVVWTCLGASGQELFDETVEIHGSGTTNPSKLYWMAMDLIMARAGRPVIMTYRGIGSGAGRTEFLARSNSFGSGDIPLTAEQYASRTEEMMQIPIGLGPVSVFYQLPRNITSAAGHVIEFEGCTLAKIFSRTITMWNDPEILQKNPFLAQVAKNITIVRRLDSSSSTTAFTEYMKQFCAGSKGWGTLASGSTITWPAGTIAVEGSDNVAEYVRLNEYAIGYMDSGHGISRNLPEIAIRNADGLYLTSKQSDVSTTAANAFAQKKMPATLLSDWSAFNLYNYPGPKAWPIVVVTYVYAYQNLTSSGVAGRWLRAFAEFLLSDEIGAMMASVAYTPLPTNWRKFVLDSLDLFIFHNQTSSVIFETAAQTLPDGRGNAGNVISAKRRSWAEFQRFQIMLDRQADALRVTGAENLFREHESADRLRVARYDQSFTDVQAQLATLNNRLNMANDIAIAAIVFGVVSFVLLIVVMACFRPRKQTGSMPTKHDAQEPINASNGRQEIVHV